MEKSIFDSRMDITQEFDDFLRESIEYSLGPPLPESTPTLELKHQSSDEAQQHIRDQCFYFKSKLLDKDKTIQCLRAESNMNGQAVKKFVQDNQKLAMKCTDLLSQCEKWENGCLLYERDVKVLMEFGNEADERAKEADSRVLYLEEELDKLYEELKSFKTESEGEMVSTLTDNESTENFLIDTLLSTFINEDEVASIALSFLEANSGVDMCQKMLKMWDSLNPSTRNILALASEVKKLQEDKDHLRINLLKAEDEVTVLFDENNMLDKENTRLTRLLQEERHLDSGGKHSSGSIKNYKRKSSPCPKENIPIEKKIDFSDADSPRQVLSPLLHNK